MKESIVPLTLESGEQVTLTVQEYEPGDDIPFTITVAPDPCCPRCGEAERVRAFKVHMGNGRGWSSECLGCGTWFDEADMDPNFVERAA